MNDIKKVLQMNFATLEGGSLRISVENTLPELTVEAIGVVMDQIVAANIFKTNKGEVVRKTSARYLTQEIEKLELA